MICRLVNVFTAFTAASMTLNLSEISDDLKTTSYLLGCYQFCKPTGSDMLGRNSLLFLSAAKSICPISFVLMSETG